ncbi:MAG TPA: cytochrome c oxidase subunit II transmembrane domain-containing protein, partial [Actinomycetes bacterium]|nr:cytochrome c oxidase subunit II transmembrane domain-containing protein [Actinomycetes bacterium]
MTSDRVATVRRRRMAAAVVGSVLLLAVSGCSLNDLNNQIAIPDPVTNSGDRIFHLWQATWLALWVIGFFTWALMLGAAWFYRRRRDDYVPKQTRYNVPIEVLYTVTPMIVIMVFAWFTI